MASKEYKARVQHKYGTEAEWNKATNFIPLKGEIIVYTDLNKLKIGDGITVVTKLDFCGDGAKISMKTWTSFDV